MLLRLIKKKKKTLVMMSIKSQAIVAKKRAIMQILARSKRTSNGLATSIPITNDGKKVVKVSYIYYPV